MEKKVILITGISSGLGKETAALLVKAGHIVFGTSRSDLQTETGVNLVRMDVTDPSSVEKGIQSIIVQHGKIDVLVNNAGMGYAGALEEFSEEESQKELNTNFLGVYRLCKAVLPHMRNQRSGTIINISSIGGIMGLPFQGFYSASKYAIEGFSEALRYEVKQFNIHVVVIRPGDFSTNFTGNRKIIARAKQQGAYAEQFGKTLSIIEKEEQKGQKPVVLARKILSVVNRKNPCTSYVVASFEQKLAVWLKAILPAKIFYRILSDFYGFK